MPKSVMKARCQRILDLLGEKGEVRVKDLAREFNVLPNQILYGGYLDLLEDHQVIYNRETGVLRFGESVQLQHPA